MTTVSIVIPTRNGMPRFARVLDAIEAQRCDAPFDLYAIDTESTDGTWEELERRGIRRQRIRKHEFDHGGTRNRGIAETAGDLVVSTVQDATPKDANWLQALVDAVTSRDDAAGAYSKQEPYPEHDPLLRLRLENWSAGRTEPRVQRLEAGERLDALQPLERLARCAFDDVSSVMRRSVWRRFPHPIRRFGEDVAWGRAVVEAGLAIVFEPRSCVLHSHDDGALADFRRIYLDHANLHELFGITTVPAVRDAWRNSRAQFRVYETMLADLARRGGPVGRGRAFARRLAFAETFGQWLGARSVRKGTRGLFALVERFAAGR